MWPWGHAAVGYTLYSAFSRMYYRKPPSDAAALVVLFGTQLPDFNDKPLAWTFDVLPTGRSLGHSLLTAAVILIIGQAIFQYVDQRELTVAFVDVHLSGVGRHELRAVFDVYWSRFPSMSRISMSLSICRKLSFSGLCQSVTPGEEVLYPWCSVI